MTWKQHPDDPCGSLQSTFVVLGWQPLEWLYSQRADAGCPERPVGYRVVFLRSGHPDSYAHGHAHSHGYTACPCWPGSLPAPRAEVSGPVAIGKKEGGAIRLPLQLSTG